MENAAPNVTAEGTEPVGSKNGRPEPRMIRSALEAEDRAAEWLRWFGFEDAKSTGAGADGGVDVRGKSMVAQVKMHMVPIGRPDLQRLYGVAQTESAVSVFFALTDYTRDARAWADQVGMALFRFSPAGEAEPINEYAEVLQNAAEHRTAAAEAPVRPPLYGIPIGCSDEVACRALTPRRAGLRRVERIAWVRQGWLPCANLTYDYNYLSAPNRKGQRQNLYAQIGRALELVSGSAITVPPARGDMVIVDRGHINIRERYEAAELVDQVEENWQHLSTLHQPAAVNRYWDQLGFYGVPRGVLNLRVNQAGVFALPFFAALIENPGGQRFAVAEGVSGSLHDGLSSTFTYYAPELMSEVQAGRSIVA